MNKTKQIIEYWTIHNNLKLLNKIKYNPLFYFPFFGFIVFVCYFFKKITKLNRVIFYHRKDIGLTCIRSTFIKLLFPLFPTIIFCFFHYEISFCFGIYDYIGMVVFSTCFPIFLFYVSHIFIVIGITNNFNNRILGMKYFLYRKEFDNTLVLDKQELKNKAIQLIKDDLKLKSFFIKKNLKITDLYVYCDNFDPFDEKTLHWFKFYLEKTRENLPLWLVFDSISGTRFLQKEIFKRSVFKYIIYYFLVVSFLVLLTAIFYLSLGINSSSSYWMYIVIIFFVFIISGFFLVSKVSQNIQKKSLIKTYKFLLKVSNDFTDIKIYENYIISKIYFDVDDVKNNSDSWKKVYELNKNKIIAAIKKVLKFANGWGIYSSKYNSVTDALNFFIIVLSGFTILVVIIFCSVFVSYFWTPDTSYKSVISFGRIVFYILTTIPWICCFFWIFYYWFFCYLKMKVMFINSITDFKFLYIEWWKKWQDQAYSFMRWTVQNYFCVNNEDARAIYETKDFNKAINEFKNVLTLLENNTLIESMSQENLDEIFNDNNLIIFRYKTNLLIDEWIYVIRWLPILSFAKKQKDKLKPPLVPPLVPPPTYDD